MYVTRPLSLYYRYPDAALEQPPDGPGSGILVIQDEEAEAELTCCGGLFQTSQLKRLPFPQNRKLKIRYSTGTGKDQHTYRDDVFCIPVTGQPLASNRYYVVKADGKNKGKVCTCSKEEDQTKFLLMKFTHDVKPTPFDSGNIYQQIEIIYRNSKTFHAKAVASNGIPPTFLRRKGWQVYHSVPSNYFLDEALGLNMQLRAKMPDLEFQSSTKRSNVVVVGKWYCPFMFVNEGDVLRDQMKRSMFYEMTLQQFWEEIYSCENDHVGDQGNIVEVSVGVIREMAMLNGSVEVQSNMHVVDGYVSFNPTNSIENGLGLSQVIWERMRWEQQRGGWVGDDEVGIVERVEVFEGANGWKKFWCYVLVERFVLKRMDGSVVLTYEFRHTDKIRVKWERDFMMVVSNPTDTGMTIGVLSPIGMNVVS